MANPHALLTVTQAAKRLGVSPNTLRAWADRGAIPVLRMPSGHRRFEAAALDAARERMNGNSRDFLASNRNDPTANGGEPRHERQLTSAEREHVLAALREMDRMAHQFEIKDGESASERSRFSDAAARSIAVAKDALPDDDWRREISRERSAAEWAAMAAQTERMFQLAHEIAARHGGPSATNSVEEVRAMREERTQELMRKLGWE